jgi:hypothetical protein
MGCGCQGRADSLAEQLHRHPHRVAAVAVVLAVLAVAAGAGLLILAPKVRDFRG